MKKIVSFIVVVLSTYVLYSQQDAMYTHYMFNTLAVNPAYAGSRDALSVTGLYRHQWVSFPSAPVTQTITLHTPIAGYNIGLGLSIVNDKIGPSLTTSIHADFAYQLQINSEGHKLAFGLKAGVNLLNTNLTNLSLVDHSDVTFNTDIQNELLPNFGVGIYYSAPSFYVGLSTPKLLQNNIYDDYDNNLLDEKRHFFFIAGAMFSFDRDYGFKPTCLVKAVPGAPIEVDITASLYYRQKVWFGLGYRTMADAMAMIGFQITDAFALGYSYDWSFVNNTARYNYGTHEIMLRYDLNKKNKVRSYKSF